MPQQVTAKISAPLALTRRQFTRLTGLWLGIGPSLPRSQEAKIMQVEPLEDVRIPLLEAAHGLALTDAQRTRIGGELKDVEDMGAALRLYKISDGGSEPATVFHPLPHDTRRKGTHA